MRQRFTMMVPLDLVVTSNRSAQTWKRKKVKDSIRALTRKQGAGLYPCGRATVNVGLVKRNAGIYDPSNTSDTWKGLADELVDMGVVASDDWRNMLGPIPYHHGIDRDLPVGVLRAVVTLTDWTPTPVGVTL